MPWCEPCDRFYNPNTLSDAGDCPEGHHVADAEPPAAPTPVPWHFKLLLVAAIGYLGWRLIQMLGWLIDWLI